MKLTLSVLKANIGSIGGRICPSRELLKSVRKHAKQAGIKLLIDWYVTNRGNDITILATPTNGINNVEVNELAWDALSKGTRWPDNKGRMAPARIS